MKKRELTLNKKKTIKRNEDVPFRIQEEFLFSNLQVSVLINLMFLFSITRLGHIS